MTRTTKAERQSAKEAIAQAAAAEDRARKLAKSLPRTGSRRRIEQLLEASATARKSAKREVRQAPALAAFRVSLAADRLAKATGRVSPPGAGERPGRARRQARLPSARLAMADPEAAAARTKDRKREVAVHKDRVERVQGWAAKVAAAVVAQSAVTNPRDPAEGRKRKAWG